jgi:hypothetical protein
MHLPTELWEDILSYAGPLRTWSKHVDVRRVAAIRIQRTWRARSWKSGALVTVDLHGVRRRGVLLRIDFMWCVRLLDRRVAFLFLPHPTARVAFERASQKG